MKLNRVTFSFLAAGLLGVSSWVQAADVPAGTVLAEK